MTRTPEDAVAWASTPRSGYGGYCLKFVRDAYAVPTKYSSARDAWNGATCKHPTTSLSGVPYGAPLFMDKSSSKYGHVALYAGNGRMCTTDSQSTYTRVDSVQSWINAGYHLLGWTEDLNGVRVLPSTSGADDTGPAPLPTTEGSPMFVILCSVSGDPQDGSGWVAIPQGTGAPRATVLYGEDQYPGAPVIQFKDARSWERFKGSIWWA